ncbi:MAG: hypothetical protein RLY16_2734 [Bacteroidota bacterium]|jgi:hypothetical protein
MKTTIPHTGVTALAQITNNTTRWIGHRKNDNQSIATGQTFTATSNCQLKNIEVYSNLVTRPGEITMTLHSFDPIQKSWGPVLNRTCVDVDHENNDKWIPFDMEGTQLSQGMCYGFKIESAEAYMGVGEAAGGVETPPYVEGQEWEFTNNNQQGSSYSYFSLAFKVDAKY